MAIRKSAEEAFVVAGERADWFRFCVEILPLQGFAKVESNETLCQVTANYKKMSTWGTLVVTLTPEANDHTRITAKVTANVDNVYALFRSPTQKILDQFKAGLT